MAHVAAVPDRRTLPQFQDAADGNRSRFVVQGKKKGIQESVQIIDPILLDWNRCKIDKARRESSHDQPGEQTYARDEYQVKSGGKIPSLPPHNRHRHRRYVTQSTPENTARKE
jgi:hypothetical protein